MNEQNPSHSLAESISALIDSQASELELQRILKASEQDPEVKAVWLRYQMVGSLLRGETISYGDNLESSKEAGSFAPLPNFAQRVSAAIAAEDQLAAPAKTAAKQGLWHQLGRVALVASVAGGMVLGVQQFNTSEGVGSEVAAVSNSVPAPAVSLPSGINTEAVNTRTVAVQNGYEARPQESRRVMFKPHVNAAAQAAPISDEEVTRYVNQMIRAHSDNAVMNSNQGVLPYARVIVTEEE